VFDSNVAFTMLVGNSAAAILTIGWYANVCPGSSLVTWSIGILEIFLWVYRKFDIIPQERHVLELKNNESGQPRHYFQGKK
jgi:hypothetical protein